MQFQTTTDYAIRIVGYLCRQAEEDPSPVRAKIMAEELGISQQYIMKVIKQLKDAGAISSEQGCSGGYTITPKGEQLSFYDIICIMEENICINRCLEPDSYCSRNAAGLCPVHSMFNELQDEIIKVLDHKKVKTVWMEANQ